MFYRLGPLHVLPEQRVVRLGSEILPLAPKTFDLLLVLLQEAGEVVSRERLRQRVWPDSFVEEAVISRSVSLLRARLRPYLSEAEIIETIPKRGYRYVGPVEIQAEPLAPALIPSVPIEAHRTELAEIDPGARDTDDAPAAIAPPWSAPGVHGGVHLPSWRWTRPAALIATAVLLPVLLITAWRKHTVHAGTPSRPTLAVLNLKNLSGQDSTAWTGVVLADALSTQLSRDRGALVAEPERAARAMRDLGIRDSHPPTSEEARALGRELGADLLVSGSYLSLQNALRLDLALYNARNGAVLDRWSGTVPQAQISDAVGGAGAHFRTLLQLAPVQGGMALLPQERNQAAERFYADGVRLSRTEEQHEAAAGAFERALVADPQFAAAHAALSVERTKLGDGTAADREAQLALDTSAHLPLERRLLLQTTAYSQLREFPQAIAAATQLHRLDPENHEYTLHLAGALTEAGQLDQASAWLLTLRDLKQPSHEDTRVPLALADVSNRRGDLKGALVYAGEALTLADAHGSRSEKAEALVASGTAWGGLGDLDRSLTDLKQAESLYTALGDRSGVVATVLAQAVVMQHHDSPAAEATAERALQIAEGTHEPLLVARALLRVGNIQLVRSQEDAAAVSYQRVIALAAPLHADDVVLSALSTLGTAELAKHKMKAAEQHTQEALALAHTRGIQAQVARCTQQLAEIELGREEFASAEAHFRESEAVWKELGQEMSVNDVLFEIGDLLLIRGKLPEARAAFGTADPHAMSAGDVSLMKIDEARLTAAEGDVALGEAMAADAARTANSNDNAMGALQLLAELQIQNHQFAAVRSTLDTMSVRRKGLSAGDDWAAEMQLLQARLDTETGNTVQAQRTLQTLLHTASGSQQGDIVYRIQLAQGQLDRRTGKGTATLAAAIRMASRHGFELLAKNASTNA